MTNQQKNITIAEAHGAKVWFHPSSPLPEVSGPKTKFWDKYKVYNPEECLCSHELPDYCNDLNAMHEAEKILTGQQIADYITTLCLEIQPSPSLWNATAQERADAFVKTIGFQPSGNSG